MIRTKQRMWICLSLIVWNLAFIWVNSMLTRDISSALSKLVGKILSLFLSGPLSPAEGEGHGILRKVAHFTEFCTLGVLISWHVRMLQLPKWSCYAVPILCCVVVAFIDETIQYFVPGRGPGFLDVAIDSAGGILGTLLLAYIAYRVSKVSKIQSEMKTE